MSNKLEDVVIVEAVRTPIGTYNGSLKDINYTIINIGAPARI